MLGFQLLFLIEIEIWHCLLGVGLWGGLNEVQQDANAVLAEASTFELSLLIIIIIIISWISFSGHWWRVVEKS